MKFLANENFPLRSTRYLRNKEFDIVAIGTDNPGIQDRVIIQPAIHENRINLTFDRDYGELIFKFNYKPQSGVIYLRIEEFEADEPGKITADLVSKNEFNFDNALTVVDKNGVRQRKY